MSLINFLSEADIARMGVGAPVKIEVEHSKLPEPEPEVVGVTVETTVVRRPSEARTHLLKSDDKWGWEELRDYVVEQIEDRSGPFPRDGMREAAIFKRFCDTWKAEAPAIARYAFEVHDGRWAGAPIRIQRFCRGSDEFFARPIQEKILAARGQ